MLKEIKREKDVITNVDFFNEIILKIKETKKWPEMLIEYASANNHDKVGLYNYEFDPHFVLKPGGSEGYYLDLGIYGNYTLIWRNYKIVRSCLTDIDRKENNQNQRRKNYG